MTVASLLGGGGCGNATDSAIGTASILKIINARSEIVRKTVQVNKMNMTLDGIFSTTSLAVETLNVIYIFPAYRVLVCVSIAQSMKFISATTIKIREVTAESNITISYV